MVGTLAPVWLGAEEAGTGRSARARLPEQSVQSGNPEYERSQPRGEQQQRGRLWNCRRGSQETMSLPSFTVLADDLALIVDPGGAARAGIGKGYIDGSEGPAAVEKSMNCDPDAVKPDDLPAITNALSVSVED